MRNRNEMPTPSEFGQLTAFLAQSGVNPAQARTAVGNAVNGRNRQQIADTLRVWLKSRAKKK